MAYVGNPQAAAFSSRPPKQDLTGASGTSLTLSHAVANAESIDLFINNVRQEPTTAYSASGTTVTLTGSVVATDDIYVVYNSLALQESVPPDGSVTAAKISNNAVTDAKLANTLDLSAKALTMPSGAVLQVVVDTTETEIANNTTSEVATGLSASITPSSSSSKVLALVTLPIQRGSNSGNIEVGYYLKRGSTVIATGRSKVNVNAIVQLHDYVSLSKLDLPSTTSATTYSVTFKELVQTNRYGSTMVCSDGSTATLTLMEISG